MGTAIRELLHEELDLIPDSLLEEVYSFIKYLKNKEKKSENIIDTSLASEAVLGKDWNKPEEDEAWQSL